MISPIITLAREAMAQLMPSVVPQTVIAQLFEQELATIREASFEMDSVLLDLGIGQSEHGFLFDSHVDMYRVAPFEYGRIEYILFVDGIRVRNIIEAAELIAEKFVYSGE